jgi:hypothetical protein
MAMIYWNTTAKLDQTIKKFREKIALLIGSGLLKTEKNQYKATFRAKIKAREKAHNDSDTPF